MNLCEQDIIALIRQASAHTRADVLVGIGDDAALCQPPAGQHLVTSTDTLNVDVHFTTNCPPEALGYRALAVNLSDLAACGATPAWVQLALTLPNADADWLTAFMRGFQTGLTAANAALIGGDITRGPLAITMTVMGFVPPGKALGRNGARPGDTVVISGQLGASALGLQCLLADSQRTTHDAVASRLPQLKASQRAEAINAWLKPTAQIALGLALRDVASACIDLSDGLSTDLNHLCAASGVGACINVARLPMATVVSQNLALPLAQALALSGGEDYQLCFSVPAAHCAKLTALREALGVMLTPIGEITATPGVVWLDASGREVDSVRAGFQHF